MIAKVSRGGSASGLMKYLVGPGRSNEHETPHLVAGSPGVVSWYSTEELSGSQALELGRFLEAPNRQYGTTVTKAIRAGEGSEGSDRAEGVALTQDRRDAHVWHCSLSLAPDHPEVSDEAWGAIANDFVKAMDFVVEDENGAEVKAPCRWVAAHHGKSVNGGDHIHIAVNLVREDGTKASTSNDFSRASKACAAIEAKHGLTVLESRQNGHGVPDLTRAELVKAEAAGAEPARVTLGRQVRAYATGSADEAEFVRRCRRGGVLVRPRYASDRTDVVVGYSAATRPPAGQKPVWFGGGNLGRDLTLPRLRSGWPDTPEEHTAAVAEWNAAKGDKRPVSPGRESAEVDPAAWAECLTEVGQLRDRMDAVAVDDPAAWAQLAKESSGVFAAWSVRMEAEPGPLAAASQALSRFSQVRAHQVPARQVPQPGMKQAAMLLMQASSSKSSAASQALLLHTMMQMLKAMHDHQKSVQQRQAAEQVEASVRGSLMQVRATLPAVRAGAGQQAPKVEPSAADRFTTPGHAPVAGAVKQAVRPPLPTEDPKTPSPGPTQNPNQGPGRRY